MGTRAQSGHSGFDDFSLLLTLLRLLVFGSPCGTRTPSDEWDLFPCRTLSSEVAPDIQVFDLTILLDIDRILAGPRSRRRTLGWPAPRRTNGLGGKHTEGQLDSPVRLWNPPAEEPDPSAGSADHYIEAREYWVRMAPCFQASYARWIEAKILSWKPRQIRDDETTMVILDLPRPSSLKCGEKRQEARIQLIRVMVAEEGSNNVN